MGVDQKPLQRRYFPHIEGLRAVAAILVAVYHIWLGRVSGGVDVFFVVSGFLITLSLLHKIDSAGRVQWREFLSGLALRLLPAAGVILLSILAFTFLFLPEARHFETVKEIVASFLYLENWQLALQSVDYLDRENAQSPVQHYWAMSAQGQFYLIALAIVLAACGIGRRSEARARTLVGLGYVLVFVVSLGYSIYQTHFGNQVWAYYDTFARVWEFSIGALLGIAILRRPGLSLHPALGWIGLLAIVVCGLLFQVGSVFPGAAALFPTLAAALVLLGGRSDSAWSVSRLLGTRALVSLGGVAYGIYLLHWPILVFYREVTGAETVGFLPGMVIIAASIAGAFVINKLVERPFLEKRRQTVAVRGRAIAIAVVPVAAILAGSYLYFAMPAGSRVQRGGELSAGAALLDGSSSWEYDRQPGDFVPELSMAKRDLPRSYSDGCHIGLRETEARWCVYGQSENYSKTIAVVGGSHSAHWLPALERVAERKKWRIAYSTWSACRFAQPALDARCQGIVDASLETLRNLSPDILFVTANVSRDYAPTEDYLRIWSELDSFGVRVFAVRDNPWMPSDVPNCISRHRDDPQQCGARRSARLAEEFDATGVTDNVTVIDLSDYFCNADFCPPVIGGVLVYRDAHHLTTYYAKTLAPVLQEHLVAAISEVRSGRQVELEEPARIVGGVLHCGPVGMEAPLRREMLLQIRGDQMFVRRGAWARRNQDFDEWKGRIIGSRIVLSGEYRGGNAKIGVVNLAGSYVDGRMELKGKRGPRDCTFSSEI